MLRYTRQWLHMYVLGPAMSNDDDVLDTLRPRCTDASSSSSLFSSSTLSSTYGNIEISGDGGCRSACKFDFRSILVECEESNLFYLFTRVTSKLSYVRLDSLSSVNSKFLFPGICLLQRSGLREFRPSSLHRYDPELRANADNLRFRWEIREST